MGSEDTSARPAGQSRPLTVLLVEDDPGVSVVTETWLRKADFEVIVCSDGRQAEALAASRTEPIDVLIADVMLPGMRGPILAGAVHRRHPEVAVLFTSGHSPELVGELFTSNVEKALLLHKPYNKVQLQSAVRLALARRAAVGAAAADAITKSPAQDPTSRR
jgi:two-component system, cell cycle sensor histidine kinase and response regulator CckA